MTVWTNKKLSRLRDLAAIGASQADAAAELGVTVNAIAGAAHRNGIHFSSRSSLRPPDEPESIRERWLAILPRLKADLVRDILRDQA